jgi:hypothetical protein
MVFFFPTERKEGELLVQSKHEGLELKFSLYSDDTLSVRVDNFNNDGEEKNICHLQKCRIFLLYTKGSSKSAWSLSNGCSEMGKFKGY